MNPSMLRRAAIPISWTAVDQAFFTLSNLLVTLAVARGGGAEQLGRVSTALAAYLVVLGLSRSLVSEPLLAEPGARPRDAAEQASTTLTLLCGIVGAAIVGGIGLILGRPEFVVVGLALPITLLQDVLRYQAFRRGAPAVAALVDGAWLLGSVAAWPVVIHSASSMTACLCWAGGAVLGVVSGGIVLRPGMASPIAALTWWRDQGRQLAAPLLLDSVIFALSGQALVFIVAASQGSGQIGVLKAGQMYFAPLGMALVAAAMVLVPQVSRRLHSITRRGLLSVAVAAGTAGAVLCSGIAICEPLLRTLLFGGAISVPVWLLVPLACQSALTASSTVFVIVSKAQRNGRNIARSRLSSAVVGAALLVPATAFFGISGAAWALVAQTLLYTLDFGRRVTATIAGSQMPPSPVDGDGNADARRRRRYEVRATVNAPKETG